MLILFFVWRGPETLLRPGLFAINQLDVVLSGEATAKTWLKAGLTYVVPFVVANYGLLIGARAPA